MSTCTNYDPEKGGGLKIVNEEKKKKKKKGLDGTTPKRRKVFGMHMFRGEKRLIKRHRRNLEIVVEAHQASLWIGAGEEKYTFYPEEKANAKLTGDLSFVRF